MSDFILPLLSQPNMPVNAPDALSPARASEGVGFKEIMAASMAASAAQDSAGLTQKMAAVAHELGAFGQDNGILQQLRSRILAELSMALGRDLHDARGDPPDSTAPPGAEPGRQPGSLDRIAGGAKPVDGKGQAGNENGTERTAIAFAEMLQAKAAPGAINPPQIHSQANTPQVMEAGRIRGVQAEALPEVLIHQVAAALRNEIDSGEQPVPAAPSKAATQVQREATDSLQLGLNQAFAVGRQTWNTPVPGHPASEGQPVLNMARIMVPRPAADDPVSQPVPAAATEPGPNVQADQIGGPAALRAETGAGPVARFAGMETIPPETGQQTLLEGAQAVRQAARHGLEGRQTDSGFGPALSAIRIGSEGSQVPAAPAAVQAALAQVAQEAAAMPAREVRDLTLELDTAGLGRVTVRMTMRETEGLVIEMRAGSELAARALRAELPQLAQMLERHNLSAGTQLNVMSSSGFENNPDQARPQPWWFEHSGPGAAAGSQETGEAGPVSRFHVRWHWAVDLLA